MRVPTLVIGADDDPYVSPAMLRMYAGRIPNAETIIVPGAGHSLYWEQPEVFNRALLAFLARHRA